MKITITEDYSSFENGTLVQFVSGLCAAINSILNAPKTEDQKKQLKRMIQAGVKLALTLHDFDSSDEEDEPEIVSIDGDLIELLQKFKEDE